ncbi:MAG: ABC transporter ATP-binding protein [Candidatus Cloacimonadota bacterium]|nr:MAG: ABC transporter ATP-binding protein [Candidatus Cloacimonadota bacterium]PIE81627.1 MAG: ABC transporter ATP-binding protein [Candidatus Delongbacteria bacterium]
MIELININKSYKVQNRRTGLVGVVKDLILPTYSKIDALSNINLRIEKGEHVGIVGKNGSGKSTLTKIISSILRPTSGIIKFEGELISNDIKRYKRSIALMFGQRSQLYFNMAFLESIELFRLMYGVSKSDAKKRIDFLIESLSLKDLLKKSIREMSLGQRMRCEIAIILLHQPKIIFLDEPTIGLDVEVKEQFYSLIKDYTNKTEATLILISHDVSDIVNLSNRLLLLDNGFLKEDIETSKFISTHNSSKIVELSFYNRSELERVKGFSVVDIDKLNNTLSILVDKDLSVIELLEQMENRDTIKNISVRDQDFKSVLLNYYRSK